MSLGVRATLDGRGLGRPLEIATHRKGLDMDGPAPLGGEDLDVIVLNAHLVVAHHLGTGIHKVPRIIVDVKPKQVRRKHPDQQLLPLR